MIIKSIKLENYRPYKGSEEITFASGDKNITIIEGQNDSGKTSLLNALTWCLYGKEAYRTKGKEEKWNKSALNDIQVNDSLIVRVTIIMEDNLNRTVRFVRSQVYTKKGYLKAVGRESLFEIYLSENGNESFVSIPENYMTTHLPEELKEYFLFDGEQLIQFFDKDSASVKKAVYELSQLNLLENLERHTVQRKRELQEEFKKINPELGGFSKKRDELLEQKDNITQRLEANKKNIQKHKERIIELKEEIKNYGENPEKMIIEQEKLEDDIKSDEKKLKELENNHINNLLKNFSLIMGYDDILNFKKISSNLIEKKFIPSPYKKEFLEELLNSKECICGTELTEDSDCYSKIMELFNRTSEVTNIRDDVNKLSGRCESYLNKYPKNFENEIILEITNIEDLKSTIDHNKQKLKSSKTKLQRIDIGMIKEKSSKINKLERAITTAYEENGAFKSNLEGLPDKINKLNEKIKSERLNEENRSEIENKIAFCNVIINNTKEIYGDLEKSIHNKLQEITSSEFKDIHWKESYVDVLIDDNFNVSFKKENGDEISANDPSSGTQLVLALSFIIALNSLSGFKLPLIIDTPLSRLDADVRENLAKFLPGYIKDKQMTLIVTNSEYVGGFKEKIEDYVGKKYKLEYHNENGEHTKVVKC